MRDRHITVLLLVFLASLLAAPSSLLAWGRAGHEIVATVAARGLSPAATAEVATLLDGKSLAEVAALPDTWRKTEPETTNWHFVNIPKDDTAYLESRDCPPQTSEVGKDCAVAAIAHFVSVLGDRSASKKDRARALTFVVHLVGDVHQPLHNADHHDRGGNDVPVTWLGAATHPINVNGQIKDIPWNLHAVWDEAIIEHTGMSVSAYADHLLAMPAPADATGGSTVAWANEAYELAKTNAYMVPAGTPVPLGAAYCATNLPVVDGQLLRAGFRLRAAVETALSAHSKAAPANGEALVSNPKLPTPLHIVIVIEENKSYEDIIGSPQASYINALAARGAVLTRFYAAHHPSQPNYVAFFAGSTLTICDDHCPKPVFTDTNLATALKDAGKSFMGFAENLPAANANQVCKVDDIYARKHCPWLDFANVPATASRNFTRFPHDAAGFASLPQVSLVIPNLINDMHNGSDIGAEVKAGSDWLQQNLEAYATWAENNNSLLIVTWDEDSSIYTIKCQQGVITTTPPKNHIATIVVGEPVKAGAASTATYTHQDLLRTVLDMYGAKPFGGAATATDITDIWKP